MHSSSAQAAPYAAAIAPSRYDDSRVWVNDTGLDASMMIVVGAAELLGSGVPA
jgi:hypothetical protein